jgi:alpha-amylase
MDSFNNMINFEFKWDAKRLRVSLSKYSTILNGELKGSSVLNYLSSHDDGAPLMAYELTVSKQETLTITRCCTGFYDESNRVLEIAGTQGDAKLRSL